MPPISRADLSRLAGVSKAAVTQAVKRRALASEADGSIDTDLPLNSAWIKAKRAPKAKPATLPLAEEAKFQAAALKRHFKAAEPPAPPRDTESDADSRDEDERDTIQEILEANAEKLRFVRARRELAERDTAVRDLRIAKEKGQLIPRELERRKWSTFDAALKTHLRDLPRRSAARIHALSLAEGPEAVERYLEAEITQALARTVEAAKEAGLQ